MVNMPIDTPLLPWCRTQASYNPNCRHLIYGQDADLILLGLLRCVAAWPSSPPPPPPRSHEPHFSILRESGSLEALMAGGGLGEEELEGNIWSPVGGPRLPRSL